MSGSCTSTSVHSASAASFLSRSAPLASKNAAMVASTEAWTSRTPVSLSFTSHKRPSSPRERSRPAISGWSASAALRDSFTHAARSLAAASSSPPAPAPR